MPWLLCACTLKRRRTIGNDCRQPFVPNASSASNDSTNGNSTVSVNAAGPSSVTVITTSSGNDYYNNNSLSCFIGQCHIQVIVPNRDITISQNSTSKLRGRY